MSFSEYPNPLSGRNGIEIDNEDNELRTVDNEPRTLDIDREIARECDASFENEKEKEHCVNMSEVCPQRVPVRALPPVANMTEPNATASARASAQENVTASFGSTQT